MSLIYWIENTKTDIELVLPKYGILSQITQDSFIVLCYSVNFHFQSTVGALLSVFVERLGSFISSEFT